MLVKQLPLLIGLALFSACSSDGSAENGNNSDKQSSMAVAEIPAAGVSPSAGPFELLLVPPKAATMGDNAVKHEALTSGNVSTDASEGESVLIGKFDPTAREAMEKKLQSKENGDHQ